MTNSICEFEVRDYECDMQGVVNNAVYQNYLEHARHQYIKTLGWDFYKLHNSGIDAFVARIELNYKSSLRSGDRFYCETHLEQDGRIKLVFHQNLYRLSDKKLVLAGKVTTVVTKDGKLSKPNDLLPGFAKVFRNSENTDE